MKRRNLLRTFATLPFLSGSLAALFGLTKDAKAVTPRTKQRMRPGDPGWPSAAEWNRLKAAVGGHLLKPESPFTSCSAASPNEACAEALRHVQNPYFLGDSAALTQSSGWLDAWTSQPSVYAVAAQNTADIVAAVNFARKYNLRLVVKGGGHSYQGTSNAADSLLIWTRQMNRVTLHDAFLGQGCEGKQSPQPAVSVGSGAMWRDAYTAVTTQAGRYVQGGGCQTVGVAGLVQGGGFGSWSKRYGTAAGGLLEAEVVTADGEVRIANPCRNPDLFWAIKGGGGGTFGVLTRLTLRTRELPEFFGAVLARIQPASEAAYRALIAKALDFYRTDLMNPHWGEKMIFGHDFNVAMLFQGITREQAQATWAPFFEWVRARSEYSFINEPNVLSVPARQFWSPQYMTQHLPSAVLLDDRPSALPNRAYWTENREEAGVFWHGYKTAWLTATLLEPAQLPALVEAVLSVTRHWGVAFHYNKGLAGAPAEEIAAARDTATNPAVLDAFTCAFIAGGGPPAFVGLPGGGPDLGQARDHASGIGKAMDELLKVAPGAGAYVSESDYFQADWQKAFWGANYPRLAAIKRKYDPDGLFFVHHGVGSEDWSGDGFTRLA
jgi:FAD/FMN-containing dehydrogenase